MSQILEKMLLIVFGLIFLVIFFPFMNSLQNIRQGNYVEESNQIDNEIEKIQVYIMNFEKNGLDVNSSFEFSFKANISIIIESNTNLSSNLIFRFKTQYNIHYRGLQISTSFNIEIEKIYVNFYEIGFENSSKFISFY